jgi:hypothetical protein
MYKLKWKQVQVPEVYIQLAILDFVWDQHEAIRANYLQAFVIKEPPIELRLTRIGSKGRLKKVYGLGLKIIKLVSVVGLPILVLLNNVGKLILSQCGEEGAVNAEVVKGSIVIVLALFIS